MTISEKCTYIKGLAESLKLNGETPEGKVLAELIDVVYDIATTVDSIDSELIELEDFVDEMDADLADVEDIIEDEDLDYEDDDDFEDYECDGNCEDCDGCDDVFDVEEEGMRCIMCDSCGDTICFDETLDPETIVCPSCGKHIVGGDEETTEE